DKCPKINPNRYPRLRDNAHPVLYLPSPDDKENMDPNHPVMHERKMSIAEPSLPSTSAQASRSDQSVTPHSLTMHVEIPMVESPIPPTSSMATAAVTIPSSATLSRGYKILKPIGVRRVRDLSPHARYIYQIAVGLREKGRRAHTELMSAKKRLREAEKYLNSLNLLENKVNPTTLRFIMSQVKLQKVQPKGRRFSLQDKILALSLLKQSPRGYRHLQRIFALPSRKTLTNLLRKIPLEPGINKTLIRVLETTCNNLKEQDKYCTLVFDEMSIDPGLYYDISSDYIEGFQDTGSAQRKAVFADKVLVFMARGVHRKWKQAVAYYFTEGGMKTDMLVVTIKDVVRHLRNAGLNVLCTVCDQGGPNRAAINRLYKDTNMEYARRGEDNRNFGFEIDGAEIVPIYDVPHLLKCIRNILHQYKISYSWRAGGEKTATWDHIRQVYELEDPAVEYKLCHKLTDAHIANSKKMKVSIAAQVMSARVAVAMKVFARSGMMDETGIETAEFLMFVDKAFDSLNGSAVTPTDGKPLRAAVTQRSEHQEFWREAIAVFESMKCSSNTRQNFRPPTLNNWVHTLKAFSYIGRKLLDSGFNFVSPRNFNQDPLENFFCSIRSHGIRNINPNCHSFKNSFKSILIANYMSSKSPSSNCEEDGTHGLSSLISLFAGSVTDEEAPSSEITILDIPQILPPSESCVLTYVAGYVARRVLKNC
ncbi:unnamed protein product, partial [Callosobruchus maculatus]